MSYDIGYDVNKTAVVWICGIVLAAVLVIPITVGATIANRNADQHRLDVIRVCVQSGQSWIGGNCVRGSVVKP